MCSIEGPELSKIDYHSAYLVSEHQEHTHLHRVLWKGQRAWQSRGLNSDSDVLLKRGSHQEVLESQQALFSFIVQKMHCCLERASILLFNLSFSYQSNCDLLLIYKTYIFNTENSITFPLPMFYFSTSSQISKEDNIIPLLQSWRI